LIEEVRAQPVVNRPAWAPSAAQGESGATAGAFAGAALRLGGRVRHAKFGEGVVLNIEGQGDHARVQVNFQGVGPKWLVLAYANLQPV